MVVGILEAVTSDPGGAVGDQMVDSHCKGLLKKKKKQNLYYQGPYKRVAHLLVQFRKIQRNTFNNWTDTLTMK